MSRKPKARTIPQMRDELIFHQRKVSELEQEIKLAELNQLVDAIHLAPAEEKIQRIRNPHSVLRITKRTVPKKDLRYGPIIINILKKKRRIMTDAEIFQMIAETQKIKVIGQAKEQITKTISSLFYNKKIKRIKVADKVNKIYGLPKWFIGSKLRSKFYRPELSELLWGEIAVLGTPGNQPIRNTDTAYADE